MKRICIYCGSNSGKNAVYVDTARKMAQELVCRNIELVYGAGSVGIMGVLADEVLNLGGRAIGVIPADFSSIVRHDNLTELIMTADMHERKQKMFDLSDAFIALPGGLGTIEEIFEILTWAQLGYHRKPCGFLNVMGYFDNLFRFLDDMVSQHFMKKQHREMFIVSQKPNRIIDEMISLEYPDIEKWIVE